MAESTSGDSRSVTEVEFTLDDADYPFVYVSNAEDCVFELAEMLPRGSGAYAEFFNVWGVDPDRILDIAEERDSLDVFLLREYENGALFEFFVSGGCPAVTLAELGALPREVYAERGQGRVVAEIPPRYDSASVVEEFLAETPAATLNRKQDRDSITRLFSEPAVQHAVRTELTTRQRDVLRAAYDAGY